MTRHKTLSALSCLSALAMAATARAQEDWTRHFRIGMSFGMNMKTDFRTSGSFPVSGVSVGQAVPGQNHVYDDGFVKLDDTGNSVPNPEGLPDPQGNRVTTNWGYENASQYDSAAQTLTFHGTSSYSTANFSSRNDAPQLGFDMAYGGTFRRWERLAIGGEFGFNWTPFDSKDRRALSATLNQVEDVYSTGATTIPGAPYSGGFNSAGRPVIDDNPTRSVMTTPGTITGSRGLEADMFQFRIGPLIRWEMAPRWTLNGSVGGALALVDANYVFDEIISSGTTTAPNKGKFGDLETVYGGYAGAVVMYDSGHFWEAYLGAHFLTMSDAEVTSPGRSARIDFSAAIFLTAGINWSF